MGQEVAHVLWYPPPGKGPFSAFRAQKAEAVQYGVRVRDVGLRLFV